MSVLVLVVWLGYCDTLSIGQFFLTEALNSACDVPLVAQFDAALKYISLKRKYWYKTYHTHMRLRQTMHVYEKRKWNIN